MENYIGIFKAPTLEERPFIKPFEEKSFTVNLSDTQKKQYRLFFTGETNTHYTWKSEPDCWVNYGKIDDSLSSKDAYRAQYCVKLEGCDYKKILYKKLLGEANLNYLPASYFDVQKWQPVLSYLPLGNFTDDWRCGIFVKGENVSKAQNGNLVMRFEIRSNHPGVSRHDITHPADYVYELELPEGNYDWKEISKDIIIPTADTASVCVFIEAENFKGNLYIESPYLVSSNGFNILPDFSVSTSQRSLYNWLGQNLSKKEWPNFSICANGEEFFSGEIFERCHRNSECEINIPNGLLKDGENTVTIKLTSDFRDAPSYSINEVALICEPRDAFNVISSPEIVTAGEAFSLLLQINEPSDLKLLSDEVSFIDGEKTAFESEGLYAVRLICEKVKNGIGFSLSSNGHTEECVIDRCVKKSENDHVITGTSDMVYIKQAVDDMDNYLKFYMSNHIGNLITIRPVYRWSGTRQYNPEVFSKFVPLANKLGLKYANMTDGREPEGQCSNPPIEVMCKTYDGIESGFLGRQKHEQDGAYNYWFYNDFSDNYERELHYDLMVRNFQNYPDTTSHYEHTPDEQFFDGDSLSIFKHKKLPRDMQGMRDYVVSQLCKNKYNNTRHTGVSFMYKYFYEAGFDWLGAELMYGPLEPVVAALRGAYRGYEKTNGYGAHLAVQWSTFPHDVPEKYRRYRLALFLSYMHGISEINTEEGLIHLEEYFSYFNRFSDCCKSLKNEQQKFYRYTLSHTRSGEFYAPFAFIHGRCDGFSCFNETKIWGHDDFTACGAEKSWELIKEFYPVSVLDSIYKHFCPTDRPLGFYTGTPRGNTDIIPIEKHKFDRYKVISFTAYNKAEGEDMDALLSYIENGGKVIIGWPFLSVTTNRDDIEGGRVSYINHKIVDSVSGAHSVFARDFYNGKPLNVCTNAKADEVLIKTDSGIPLLYKNNIGNGEIYFINAAEYPSDEAVKDVYRFIVDTLSDQINSQEDVFLSCGEDVGFTIYDQEDGSRHIYVLAVDWYRDPSIIRKATLKVGENKYDIDVPFDTMLKIVAKDGVAVWSTDAEVEITDVSYESAVISGFSESDIMIAKDGKVKSVHSDFSKESVITLKI